jgi:hypothetical protein
MSQDAVSSTNTGSQELSFAGGNGGNTSTGFATGTTCNSSGTYRAENKYMTVVALYAAGEIFRTMIDGKKCIWYPLTKTTASGFADGGSFSSVKVEAGAI